MSCSHEDILPVNHWASSSMLEPSLMFLLKEQEGGISEEVLETGSLFP